MELVQILPIAAAALWAGIAIGIMSNGLNDKIRLVIASRSVRAVFSMVSRGCNSRRSARVLA